MRTIEVLTDGFAGDAAFDTAVSRALLARVAAGEVPESFRIYVPDRIVAFGRQDRVRAGYPAAVAAVAALGFAPVERLAGGTAAVFHDRTLSFSWAIPDPEPRSTISGRFTEIAGIVAAALGRLGVDARIGEIPGEYCPGRYSVNAGGRRKIMGVGQRLVRGAAHVGGVIVVDLPEVVNEALIPAYRHLGYAWDPATTGAVTDHAPVTPEQVTAAVLEELGSRFDLAEGTLDPTTLDRAAQLAPEHAAAIP